MMYPDKSLRYDIFCNVVLSAEFETNAVENGLIVFVKKRHELYLYELACSKEQLLSVFPSAIHYLDYFYLIIPTDLDQQHKFWKNLYSIIGPNYEKYIQSSQNMDCLRYFRRILEDYGIIKGNHRILDFGCGPGLTKDVFTENDIIGYDYNSVIAKLAKRRGMTVINEREFYSIKPESLDGCIACFVFHMAISREELSQIIHSIKRNGYVIANFYKGIGLERINDFFKQNQFHLLDVTDAERGFGRVIYYSKKW